MTRNILLLGSTGYIGSEFKKQLIEHKRPYKTLSATNLTKSKLEEFVHVNDIDTIINAAGFTGKPNVDACEYQREETLKGNFLLPLMLAEVSKKRGLTLGHVSSGCIYNGYKVGGFTEEDTPNFTFQEGNCSFYSGTKALGENALMSIDNKYIWRLRIPFEANNNPRNYITKLLNYPTLLDMRNSLSNKQEFVATCISMLDHNAPYGIYNVTNSGSITAQDVTNLMTKYKLTNKKFNFFPTLDHFNTTVVAPRSNTVLNTDKLEALGLGMKPVVQSLEETLSGWKK